MDCLFARGAQTAPHITSARHPSRRRPSRLPPGYHSVASAAAFLGRAVSGIYRDIELGRLRVHSWRGRLVIADADLHAWLSPTPLDADAPISSNGSVGDDADE